MASRWNVWKGHAMLLQAWRQASLPPGAALVITGGPPPSGMTVDVPRMVRDFGLEASVTVIPQVRDITDLILNSDAVVMPSARPEPFGLVALEAARAGRPTLGSTGGGLEEVVENGRTGWLTPSDDVAAWSKLLGSLSVAELATRGAEARAVYQDRFTLDAFRARLEGVLKQIHLPSTKASDD